VNSFISPDRIKYARESRGYSGAELAKLLGVTKQMISQYEVGSSEPSSTTLFKLVDTLKYPLTYYKKSINHYDESMPTFFRSRKSTPVKIKKAAKIMVYQFWDIDNYIRKYINFPDISDELNQFADKKKYSLKEIEDITVNLRQFWNLGLGPIVNLSAVLQEKGCIISSMHIRDKKIDAFSKRSPGGIPYIFLGSENQSAVRLRFDLAHELGHLVLHRNYVEEDLNDDELYNSVEDEANYFAAAFLLPKETFSKDVYSSSINHFLLLKKKWRASISCMINRCINLALLSDNQIQYLKNQMTEKFYWRHEPFDDIWEPEKPFLYKQAINLLINSKILTISEFLENVALSAEELEDMLFLDKGTLSQAIPENIISLR
jgi:Zn-dependent peptidase ImmA (M78 family)/DNA-binding XRE family transcriptional regulator